MPKIEVEIRPIKNEDEEIMIENLINRFKYDLERRGIKVLSNNYPKLKI